jgi:hypothetical protein
MKSLARVAGLCLALSFALLLLPGSGQAQPPKDQAWLDTQRALLKREVALQNNRYDELNQAAEKGLATSVDRVVGWMKDNLAAGDYKALLLGGDATLPLYLVQQNLEMYEKAIRGDWTEYGTKLAETIFDKIVEQLPEKLHPSLFDPTIIEQLFDLKTLADLKLKAQVIDAIQDRLAKMQGLIDKAQQALDQAKDAGGPPSLAADDPALKELEDYLANFPIHLQPLPENADGTDVNNPTGSNANGAELDKALNENITREMGADNPRLPEFLIHPLNYTCKSGPCALDQWIAQSNQSDDWTRLQNAFQGMAQMANAFNPPHRSPITPELLAAMDNWLKQLKQAQTLMFQALAAAQNSPACKVVNPTNGGDAQGGIFDNGNPVLFFHYANAAECNRLYGVFRGYQSSFMGSTPPSVTTAGTGANSTPNQSSPQAKGSSGAPTNNSSLASGSSVAVGTQSPAPHPAAAARTTGAVRAASPRRTTRTGGVDFSGPQGYVTNPDLNSQVDKLIQEAEQIKSRVHASLLKLDPTLPSRIAASTSSPNLSSPRANAATANSSSRASGSGIAPLMTGAAPASPRAATPKGGIDFSGPQAYKTNPQLDSEVDNLLKQAEPAASKKKEQ